MQAPTTRKHAAAADPLSGIKPATAPKPPTTLTSHWNREVQHRSADVPNHEWRIAGREGVDVDPAGLLCLYQATAIDVSWGLNAPTRVRPFHTLCYGRACCVNEEVAVISTIILSYVLQRDFHHLWSGA